MKPGDPVFGVESDERAGSLTTIQGGQFKVQPFVNENPVTYRAFYRQFAGTLNGQGELPVKPETARDVIRLIELARLSSATGKTLDIRGHHAEID